MRGPLVGRASKGTPEANTGPGARGARPGSTRREPSGGRVGQEEEIGSTSAFRLSYERRGGGVGGIGPRLAGARARSPFPGGAGGGFPTEGQGPARADRGAARR